MSAPYASVVAELLTDSSRVYDVIVRTPCTAGGAVLTLFHAASKADAEAFAAMVNDGRVWPADNT